MDDTSERLIAMTYKKWKDSQGKNIPVHPDEESMVLFLEDRLSAQETEKIKEHLVRCRQCAEGIAVQLRKTAEELDVPQELMEKVKTSVVQEMGHFFLEIMLKLKDSVLEVINTTGDVLVGQEFVPAAILRSRSIKDFKNEVIILKDFKEIRVEIKIENKGKATFQVTVVTKDKDTQAVIKDVRITLLKDDVELESYANDSGKVCFENIQLGRYSIEVISASKKLASISLNINT